MLNIRNRASRAVVWMALALAASLWGSGYGLLVAYTPVVMANMSDVVALAPGEVILVSSQITGTTTLTATESVTLATPTPITGTESISVTLPVTETQLPTATLSMTTPPALTTTIPISNTTADEADGEIDGTEEGQSVASDDLLPATSDAISPTVGANSDVTNITIASNGQNLNVRTGPGDEYAIVGKLKDGVTINVLEVSPNGQWYRVPFGAIGWWGWIASGFAVSGASRAVAADTGVTNRTSAAQAETVSAADENPPDGVAEDSNAAAEPAEESTSVTVPTAVTRPPNMNVRGGPGTAYGVVSTARAGMQLEILGVNTAGDWYQVRLEESDEPGWIFASLTDLLGPTDEIPTIPEDEIPEPPEPAAVQAADVGAAPPPAGGGFFGYGLQAHILGGGIDAAMNATNQLGFNWIKQQIQWRDMEGSQGALDFSELRRIVDAAGGRGISVLFSVVNAPNWAREAGFDDSVSGPPADPQAYGNFVARLAGDFCGSALKAIEVWNEQNLHYEWGNRPINPAEYMALLRVAYGRIKGACPSMLVISGAPTPAGDAGAIAMDDFTYLEGMYQNGLVGLADGIGVHPSGYNVPPSVGWQSACATIQQTGNFFNGPCDTPHHSWSFRSTMEGYRNIMVRYGDVNKRLWPTEFGWAAGGALHPAYAYANDNDFEEQARWTVEAFQMMRNWGWVGPAFLWNLNFRVVADGTEKAQWGIVRNDYSPLPIYNALQAMPK